ncbi:hypothetical protein Q8F55_001100 [Vanrija albida]|uniref:Ras-GAP domain-containing protein n=1 Tax=Vanrija albida TaxID=181172 RepID=A0ABR3QG68_9TREE
MASWSFETPVEYHISTTTPEAPAGPSKKRVSEQQQRRPRNRSDALPPPSHSPISILSPSHDGHSTRNDDHLGPRAMRVSASLRGTSDKKKSMKTRRSYGNLTLAKLAAAVSNQTERELPDQWIPGRVAVTLNGGGGREGGELRLFRVGRRKIAFTYLIPCIDVEEGWTTSDVQHVHPSVAGRTHALSLRLVTVRPRVDDGGNAPPPVPQILNELSRSMQEKAILASPPPFPFLNAAPFATHGPKPIRQPSDGLPQGAPVQRSHSKTSSSPGQMESLPPARMFSNRYQADVEETETFIYLSFRSKLERDEWFVIFRSLAKLPNEGRRATRTHRRLKIGVMDLQESQAKPQKKRTEPLDDISNRPEECSASEYTVEVPIGLQSPGRSSKQTDIDGVGKQASIRPGWSWRHRMRVELLLDDHIYARTGWSKAPHSTSTPYWGEQFGFTEAPSFSTCTLLLLRSKGDKRSEPFARVDLPLVSSFAKVADERFPIRTFSGKVIGEMRLSVSFQEIDILPLYEYRALDLAHSNAGSQFLHVMAGRGLMEGTMDHLCRIALCEGVLMPRVLDTCRLEARTPGNTLFRSNTPLSKTLEVLMRMMCEEFLDVSIGPTIRRVVNERISTSSFVSGPTGDSSANRQSVRGLSDLVESCWRDMYENRNLFPDFIRHVLAYIFRTVKEFHDYNNDLLRYKAVSSFVFLRLIGPALMSPHLFGLADGLLPIEVQRTLTLVAKVLHALAFFSDNENSRHPDLVVFKPFIRRNADAMIDYLTSLVTPVGEWPPPQTAPSEIESFVAQRKLHLDEFEGEAIPFVTEAGPVDMGAEWAMCAELWYERRQQPGTALTSPNLGTDDINALIAQYDDFLDRIHDLAMPSTYELETIESRSGTPCPSARPSIERSSTPCQAFTRTMSTTSSEESYGMAILSSARKWLGFSRGGDGGGAGGSSSRAGPPESIHVPPRAAFSPQMISPRPTSDFAGHERAMSPMLDRHSSPMLERHSSRPSTPPSRPMTPAEPAVFAQTPSSPLPVFSEVGTSSPTTTTKPMPPTTPTTGRKRRPTLIASKLFGRNAEPIAPLPIPRVERLNDFR